MTFSDEFPLHPSVCYLNHAAVSPWPKRCEQAVQKFSHENVQWGATHYPQWMLVEKTLRKQFQALLNAPDWQDIALVKNTSEGLSMIAYGLAWQEGDTVIISDEEFPSNRIVWESLKDKGVRVIEVPLSGENPEADIIAACDESTRLISISSVQYASGFKLNLKPLGQHCKDKQILFCVDAIQSLGAHAVDVKDIHADFVIADGHKWLMGPEGLGVFFSTSEARQQLTVNEYGWHMIEHVGDYDRKDWVVAKSARRFECGSPNMLATHALSASLSLILEVGMEAIARELEAKMNHLTQQLDAHPNINIISAKEKQRRAGIVTFTHTSLGSTELYQLLMKKHVICANRGGGVRFSPHFYTPLEVMDKAISLIP
ncbi:MAG: aminotransferase class V-fold PLP-dependent enzyme [Gammaproteobacteria bacterium]|nr:aminotransferase class V-fold PLP-dependent enzyme [Gammaproteobacteria bacterium]